MPAETIRDVVKQARARQMQAARCAGTFAQRADPPRTRRAFRDGPRTSMDNDTTPARAALQEMAVDVPAVEQPDPTMNMTRRLSSAGAPSRRNRESEQFDAFDANAPFDAFAEFTRTSDTRAHSFQEQFDALVAQIDQQQAATFERILGLLRDRFVAKNALSEFARRLDDLDRDGRARASGSWTSSLNAGPEGFLF